MSTATWISTNLNLYLFRCVHVHSLLQWTCRVCVCRQHAVGPSIYILWCNRYVVTVCASNTHAVGAAICILWCNRYVEICVCKQNAVGAPICVLWCNRYVVIVCASNTLLVHLSSTHLLDSMSKRDTRRCVACEKMALMWGAVLARAARVFWYMYTSFSLDMLVWVVRSSTTTSRLPACTP